MSERIELGGGWTLLMNKRQVYLSQCPADVGDRWLIDGMTPSEARAFAAAIRPQVNVEADYTAADELAEWIFQNYVKPGVDSRTFVDMRQKIRDAMALSPPPPLRRRPGWWQGNVPDEIARAMKPDEILRLADQCGMYVDDGAVSHASIRDLQSFAAAIAEHCAQVVDARRENVFGRPALELAAARNDIRAAFPAPETKP